MIELPKKRIVDVRSDMCQMNALGVKCKIDGALQQLRGASAMFKLSQGRTARQPLRVMPQHHPAAFKRQTQLLCESDNRLK